MAGLRQSGTRQPPENEQARLAVGIGAGSFATVPGVSDTDDKEVLIPEVLPPEGGRDRGGFAPPRPPPRAAAAGPERSALDRVANVLGPVFSGLLLDVFSFGIPGRPAFFLCTLLGFWFGRVCGLRFRHCLFAALIAGYYGMLSIPRLVPFATCIGLFFTLRNAEVWKKK